MHANGLTGCCLLLYFYNIDHFPVSYTFTTAYAEEAGASYTAVCTVWVSWLRHRKFRRERDFD